jgi:hypothetical protein
MTAFGTVGAVVAALGIALWSERRTDNRLAAERKHSDEQLADERAFSRAQLAEERRIAIGREQLAEAYAVQVAMTDWNAGPSTPGTGPSSAMKTLRAIVVNHGGYTIMRVEAQLRLAAGGNASIVSFATSERVGGTEDLDPRLRQRTFSRLEGMTHADRLTPWDAGIYFQSDPMSAEQLPGAYPVVRWVDRWGAHWEHRRGEVRQIRDGEEWVP